MATIRSFTDLKQSKKLAQILPLESADMRYGYIAPYEYSDRMYDGGYDEIPYPKDFLIKNPNFSANEYEAELPCWSLAAMLDALPSNLQLALAINDYQGDIKERYAIGSVNSDIYDCYADNPVDACYEMIIKLHEQNLL